VRTIRALFILFLLATPLLARGPLKGASDAVYEVRKALRELGLKEKDLRTRHDVLPVDPWRLEAVDRYLSAPLDCPVDAWKRLGPWLASPGDPVESLNRAGAWLGLSERKPVLVELGGRHLPATLKDLLMVLPGPVDAPTEKDLAVLPEEVRRFLAYLCRATAMAARERTAAVAALSEAEWVKLRQYGSQINTGMPVESQAPMMRELHARIDLARIYRGAMLLAAEISAVPDVAAKMAARRERPEFHLVWTCPAGRVEIGGFGRNVYAEDVLLSVDLGGDDLYTGSAGGTLYTPAKTSVVIDLGGDDVYRTTVGLAQGSGTYGVGVLVDAAGNDLYETKNVSQGSGHMGVGILWDLAGDDRYVGNCMVQGTGFEGIGILRDDGGRDEYRLRYKGQGHGAARGVGVLDDRGGNDSYSAGGLLRDEARDNSRFLSLSQGFGLGLRADRPEHSTSGGLGLLVDHAGDDRYLADVYGQGCAYWYAIGALLDGGGRDFYEVHNYGQGAGIHMAVGLLFDLGGDDRYLGGAHALGHALDRAFGFFLDVSGDDVYDSTDGESQGAAVKPWAVGLFADLRGDDVYRGGGNGYVRAPKDGGEEWPKAFFFDRGGNDRYAPKSRTGTNDEKVVTNRYGFGRDR
jgi:hypothetical protein